MLYCTYIFLPLSHYIQPGYLTTKRDSYDTFKGIITYIYMTPLKWITWSYYTGSIRLLLECNLTPLVGSFVPFKEVILNIGDYKPEGVIWFPFSFQCMVACAWWSDLFHMLSDFLCAKLEYTILSFPMSWCALITDYI